VLLCFGGGPRRIDKRKAQTREKSRQKAKRSISQGGGLHDGRNSAEGPSIPSGHRAYVKKKRRMGE